MEPVGRMEKLYEVIVYSDRDDQIGPRIKQQITELIGPFKMEVGKQVEWTLNPAELKIDPMVATVILYIGKGSSPDPAEMLLAKVPILPVVPRLSLVSALVPEGLRYLNCAACGTEAEFNRTCSALLETLKLLPSQRRIFLSYKRSESRQAALQLADKLTELQFEVFLDTRGMPPAVNFQDLLWHKLCDCDVLIMLDTPGYFTSRWTTAEFGRALSKEIPVLRVTWPDSTPDKRSQTAARVELLEEEIDPDSGRIDRRAVLRIAKSLEQLRAQSHAIRNINLVSRIKAAVEKVGGSMQGQGASNSVYLKLANGRQIKIFPNVGVPTSDCMHAAFLGCGKSDAAVAYDEIGVLPSWVAHLDWLAEHIPNVRLVKASHATWQFADWS